MPVARLQFSGYQSSNENGGGNHAWQNVQGAGASAYGAGAFDTRDPNSANMNWIRSQGDGARGSASIPAGSTVTGIVVGFQGYQTGGAQTGGTYDCSIFKGGSAVASKSGSLSQGATVGPFGASNDLWGLGGLATPTYFTNMYFGLHLNFPNITSDISVFAWNGYMDIYYNDPVPIPTSISVGAGNSQSADINTQYGLQLYAIVTDQGGNVMPGVSVTFTMPASGATARFNSVGGPATATAITNASGGAVSPFFWANGTAGSFQPVADVTGSSPLVFVRFNATNTTPPPPLVPTTISKLQGDGQQAAVSTAFGTVQKVKVWDQFVHVMNNVEITWSVPGSGARGTYAGGTPAHSFTDASGVAVAPVLTANSTAGVWVENAFPTVAPGVIAGFNFTNLANNAPPTATTLVVQQGNSQSAALSSNFATALIVSVLDQYGSPFAGTTVTGTIPNANNGSFLTGGGQVRSVVSDANGLANLGTVVAGPVASAAWNLALTATGTGGTAAGPFRNVDAAIVTAISVIGGSGQTTNIGTPFAQPLRVRATNGLSNGVQNFSVTFTAPGSAASCTFTGVATQVVLSDASGYSQSVVPVANSGAGSYNVTASGSGVASVLFPMTNGANYNPEVCLASAAPSNGCTNQTGTPAWTNPNLAASTAAGGNFATITVNTGTGASVWMYSNPNAAWVAVPDTAKITRIQVTFWANAIGLNRGNINARILVRNVLVGATKNTGTLNTAFTSYSYEWLEADLGFLTAADMKAALSGVALRAGVISSQSGATQVNGMVVSYCYQTVIPPPERTQVPLALCDAG